VLLATIALVGNAWIATTVIHSFEGPEPANREFGTPNVQVPISDAFPQPVRQFGPLYGFSGAVPPIAVSLLLSRLDPETQTASFSANLEVPSALLRRIPGRGGHMAVSCAWGCHLTPYGRGLSLPMRIGGGYVGGETLQIPIPLAKLVAAANGGSPATVAFNLPFQGRPGAFPGDWYEVADDVVVLPPTSWVLVDSHGVGQPSVPVRLSLAAGPAMRGYSVAMVSKPNVDGSTLRIVVQTDAETQKLAYVIGSVPLLLAFVALGLLLSSLGGGYSTVRIRELAFTIVLGLLAVLPIRQVTVPPGLNGLTRIDLLLAMGLTMSVGVLLLALAIQIGLPGKGGE
jgi:hypothetical protein